MVEIITSSQIVSPSFHCIISIETNKGPQANSIFTPQPNNPLTMGL